MNENQLNIIGFHLPDEPYGCFSNWYMASFEYAGRRYCCVEQYMMSRKVALARRYDLVSKIMDSNDPAEIKSLGGKQNFPEFVDVKDVWDRNCRHIVKQGVYANFRQNPELCQELLSTKNALLAECAGQDRVWGIGINLHNEAWKDVSNWDGNNYLGITLMEVRDLLRQEILKNGKVEFVDYHLSDAIPEWMTTPRVLARYPQYYKAIHSYADQLKHQNEKDAFYNYPLSDTEYAMAVNMGGGLPPIGFYEMKQEIYEIANFLSV